ncbi:hypothetical protein BFP97_15200 [Roseivirga sp. 4D4]|uniref:tetratricopeptide repeat protein n=1 Tax=Roseivirga sp. 4D4 TaxID=1889784 RepID=UPI000852992D|nr:tetratricopeptide repeat protein [Roseivirga sp. 4D4]OEK02788.1 hypothetical protein BFP97_15200 [Roseivirga sp. 4D4]
MAYVFNSKIENPDRLERMLVARKSLVDLLEKKANALIEKGTLSQSLLIGPRGSGKTHMLRVFFNRIWNHPKKDKKIVIAYMVEDEYGIDTFLDLLIRIFNAFMRWYDDESTKKLFSEIEKLKRTPPDTRQTLAIEILNNYLDGRDLLIIIENLNEVFQGLGKLGQSQLRDYVQQYNNVAFFGSSQALFIDIQKEDKPFQNFFNITHLKKLTYEEAMSLVNTLAEEDKHEEFKTFLETPRGKANVHAVYDLTQGNHRLLVTFFDFLKAEFKSDLAEAFLHTIDKLKPYYESYFKLLSPQQQKIVQYLSSERHAVTGKEVSLNCFIAHTTISKQMSELQRLGYVESNKIGKDAYYEIAEPMLRIAFEVNENKKGIVSIFIDFLTQLYEVEEITKRYLKYKHMSAFQTDPLRKTTYEKEAFLYKQALGNSNQFDLQELEDRISQIVSSKEREEFIASISLKRKESLKGYDEQIGKLIDDENFEQALELSLEILDESPDDSLALSAAGFSYVALGNLSKAKEVYNKVVKHKPKDSNAWNVLGSIHSSEDELEKAIQAYNKSIETDDKNYDSWFQLGKIYHEINDFDSSEKALQVAVTLTEEDGYGWFKLGNLQRVQKLYNKAIVSFKRSLELEQGQYETWNNLILTYMDENDYQAAESILKKALKTFPDHEHISSLNTYYYTQINEKKDFLRYFRDWLKLAAKQKVEELYQFHSLTMSILLFNSRDFIESFINDGYQLMTEYQLESNLEKNILSAVFDLLSLHDELDQDHIIMIGEIIKESKLPKNVSEEWLKYADVGIKYFYEADSRALFELAKEERMLFLKFTEVLEDE